MVNKDLFYKPRELKSDIKKRKATLKFCDLHEDWGHKFTDEDLKEFVLPHIELMLDSQDI